MLSRARRCGCQYQKAKITVQGHERKKDFTHTLTENTNIKQHAMQRHSSTKRPTTAAAATTSAAAATN